jgi:hypothetical protein
MGEQTLPSGSLPNDLLESKPHRHSHEAHDDERVSLSKPIADVTELGKPGIVEVVDLEIIERADKPRQRHVPLE